MRKYTDEEKAWLYKFCDEWKVEKWIRGQADTMNQSWENYNRTDPETGETEEFTNHMEYVMSVVSDRQPDKEALRLLKPIEREIGEKSNHYTASDYYALPSLWYSHNYEDKMIRVMDDENKLKRELEGKQQGRDFPQYPGIIQKGRIFEVTSYFEGTKRIVGRFFSLSEAKEALKSYNKSITFRGYGVDYE